MIKSLLGFMAIVFFMVGFTLAVAIFQTGVTGDRFGIALIACILSFIGFSVCIGFIEISEQ